MVKKEVNSTTDSMDKKINFIALLLINFSILNAKNIVMPIIKTTNDGMFDKSVSDTPIGKYFQLKAVLKIILCKPNIAIRMKGIAHNSPISTLINELFRTEPEHTNSVDNISDFKLLEVIFLEIK